MKGLSGKEIRLIMIYRYNRYARLYSFIKNSTAPRPASKNKISAIIRGMPTYLHTRE